MANLNDSTAGVSSSSKRAGGRWLYPVLLAVQTAGAALLAFQVLPIYRRALIDPTAYDSGTTVSALGASALIQLGYWMHYRIRPAPPRFVNVGLGHIVLFLARLIFLLPTAIFSFLFIAKTVDVQMPPLRYVVILFGLFSLFCYVRELERFGIRLLGKQEE
jgi:hypothetical protein